MDRSEEEHIYIYIRRQDLSLRWLGSTFQGQPRGIAPLGGRGSAIEGIKDASIYMMRGTNRITLHGGKAKAMLGASAHATRLIVTS